MGLMPGRPVFKTGIIAGEPVHCSPAALVYLRQLLFVEIVQRHHRLLSPGVVEQVLHLQQSLFLSIVGPLLLASSEAVLVDHYQALFIHLLDIPPDQLSRTFCMGTVLIAGMRKHWRHIRSNNPLERLFREVRRRTRVVGAFPDLNSCLMLAAARLKWTEEKRREKKRYMDIDLLLEDLICKAKEVNSTT